MALAVAVGEQRRARLPLHVDEPGRNHQAGGVDYLPGLFGRQVADPDDAITNDADVHALRRLTRAVEDLSTTHD